MMLRCYICGRIVTDTTTSTVGVTDLGDDINVCADCHTPPHSRSQPFTRRHDGTVTPRWGTEP